MTEITNILVSLLCILVTTALIKVVNWVWLRPKKVERLLKEQGIYGNPYKLLVGDLKDFVRLRAQALENPMTNVSNDYFSRAEPLRHQLTSKYGKDYILWAGPIPMVHLSKPELIREAFNRMNEFRKTKINPVFDKLFPGVVSYEGDKWVKHRKIISPAFHVEKLKLMLPAFHDSCSEIIDKWETEVAKMGSMELDVWPDLMKLSADVISRAAFGSNYEEGQRIFELLKEQISLTLIMLQSVYIPGMRFLPTSRNRKFKDLENQIHTLLRAIINKRKEEMKAGKAPKADLLGILLDSNLKSIQQDDNNKKNQSSGMSLEEVIDECKLFYLGGQETTSTLLVWTLILLSKHQDWQEKAREEVLQTYGTNVPNFEGLSHLKTVTMILYEVLRLYPPVMQLSRTNHKGTTIGNLSLPSDVIFAFSVHCVHRDQDIWGIDAQEFNPNRFAEGISKATNGNNSFFPFGWGPRICLGEKFAMTEAKLAISMILQRFSFELSASYVHAPMTMMFLQPQYGAQLIMHKL